MAKALALPMLFLAAAAAGAGPDFDALLDHVNDHLNRAGDGGQTGARIELRTSGPEGWEILTIAAWDGTAWHVLALSLRDPELVDEESMAWQIRSRALLDVLVPEDLDDLTEPVLFEIPPPDFLPIMSTEVRNRQFEFEDYWYQASWINDGGPDEFARWTLRRFELVMQPDTGQ